MNDKGKPGGRFRPTLSALDAVEEGIRAKKTHDEISAEIHKARPRVTNLARLLDLPSPVLSAVRSGKLAPKTAEALLALKSDEEIIAAFRHVVAFGLSADKARAWLKERSNTSTPDSADLSALERALSTQLCAQVDVRKAGNGHTITIHASDLDCIDGILSRLGIEL